MNTNHSPRRIRNAALAGRLTAAVSADDGPGVTALLAQILDADTDTEGVLLAIAALAASERNQAFLDEYALAALDASETVNREQPGDE